MALAATSAQLAKSMCVTEFGVGEDLTFNFMGWVDSELSIICQLKREFMNLDHSDRLTKCGALCIALRRYWGVTDITMIAEGYCSLDAEKTQGLDLAKAYIDKAMGIEECLTVTHAHEDSSSRVGVDLVAVPYVYEVGRNIKWLEMLTYPNNAEKILRNSSFPKMLVKALKEEIVMDQLPDEAYEELRATITTNGFYIQEFS